MAKSIQVVFDCEDPDRLARFWAAALGYILQPPPAGFDAWEDFVRAAGIPEDQWGDRSAVIDPDEIGPRIFFQRVPEGKVAKNRIHLDVNVGGGRHVALQERRQRVDAGTRRLVAEGASVVAPFDQEGEYWVVMTDPEGNEFCLH